MATSVAGQLKKLFQQSAIYGIGHILTRSLGFLLLPLYTNVIPPGEFGKAALLFTFLAIMNVIYNYGMDTAFMRYVALEDNIHQQRVLFTTGFLSHIFSSAIFSLFLIWLQKPAAVLLFHSPIESNLIYLCAGILFFDTLSLMPFMTLRAKERAVPFASLKLANVVLNVAANVVFIIWLNKGVTGIFLANLVSSAFTFILLAPIVIRFFIPGFDRTIFREMARFGLPYIPTGLAVVMMDLLDRFILERMTDFATTGIYSAGYKLGMFMALFVAAFRFAWHPFFLSTSRQPNAKQIFSKVLTYFVLVCAFVFLVLSLFIDEIVRLNFFGITLFGEEYWGSTQIVPLILISYVIYGIYVNFVVGVYLKKKTAMLPLITGISAVANIAANIVLIPYLGMMGSAWATVIGYATMAVLLYVKIQPHYRVQYEWIRILKVSAVAIGLYLLQLYVFSFEAWWHKIGYLFLFGIALLATGFLDNAEKNRLRQMMRIH